MAARPSHGYGRSAEARASAYLEALGFIILKRNVRLPEGEIDILAREGDTLVIVEVKGRRTAAFGRAIGSVDARKRATLRACAQNLLQFSQAARNLRFDVVAIDGERLTLYRNAFS